MKMKAKYCVTILIAVNLVFSLVAFCEANTDQNPGTENLVMNGDFEEVFKGQPNFWNLDAWMMTPGYTNIASESADPLSGQNYVTIENLKSNDARLVQDIAVKPSTVYLLSCYIKASDIPSGKIGANISVIQQDLLDSSAHFENTQGKWQYLEYAVKTGPKQMNMRVGIRLGFFGNDTTGKASFDKFRLEEVKNPSNLNPIMLQKDNQITATQKAASGFVIIFIVAGILAIGIVAFIILALFSKKKGQKDRIQDSQSTTLPGEEGATPLLLKKEAAPFTKIDIFLVAGLMIIYAAVAFTNLGSFEAPTTYWRPVSRGENVIVDFGSDQLIRRIYFWEGLPGGHSPDESKYEVEGSTDGTSWMHIATLNPKTICWWYFETTNVQARYVRVTADVPGSWLNEVVFLGNDTVNPIKIERVMPGVRQVWTEGKVENLFDEYSDVGTVKRKKQLEYRPQIMTGMSPGFDEQYHGRTALEHLNFRQPYENTHPPLGKLLIATGILIFGMTPFGWRCMGVLFGVLIIPLMFAFGKRLFKKTEYAFFAAFLMATDFMHFTQSRIATIDTYPVFFIILTFYFMYRFCEMSYLNTDFRKMLVPLLLSGVAWGLGAASKWTAVYAWFGLAVVFFVSLYKKAQEVREARLSKSLKKNKDEWAAVQQKIDEFPVRAWQLVGWSVLVFVLIPVFIYCLSYIPILLSKELKGNFGWIIENNIGMFRYHSELKATHSFSSHWWEWPLMTKPMAYNYGDGLPEGQTQRLFSFGNPAVWWVGSLAALVLIVMAIVAFIRRISTTLDESPANMKTSAIMAAIMRNARFKDMGRFVILVGFATEYLPWIISPRQLVFIYHYFPSVPFIIFAVVFLIKMLREKVIEPMKDTNPSYRLYALLGNGLIYLYLAIALILFIMFYPIIAGVPADTNFIKTWLRWFPNNWYFA